MWRMPPSRSESARSIWSAGARPPLFLREARLACLKSCPRHDLKAAARRRTPHKSRRTQNHATWFDLRRPCES